MERNFPEYAISHTAARAAEADVHMTNGAGEVVILESKYKERITGADVDKFYRDVAEVGKAKKLRGAVFVSVLNRSIPNKGSLCIEKRAGVPVMFAAFDGEDDLQANLASYVRLFWGVAAHFVDEPGAGASDDILLQVAAYLDIVAKNRERLAHVREQCLAPMDKMLREAADSNQRLLGLVEALLGKHGRPAARIVCADCGAEFKRPGLKQAVARHGRGPTTMLQGPSQAAGTYNIAPVSDPHDAGLDIRLVAHAAGAKFTFTTASGGSLLIFLPKEQMSEKLRQMHEAVVGPDETCKNQFVS